MNNEKRLEQLEMEVSALRASEKESQETLIMLLSDIDEVLELLQTNVHPEAYERVRTRVKRLLYKFASDGWIARTDARRRT